MMPFIRNPLWIGSVCVLSLALCVPARGAVVPKTPAVPASPKAPAVPPTPKTPATPPPPATPPAPATPAVETKSITKAELQALVKQVETSGQNWAEGKTEDAEVLKALKAVRYESEVVSTLDAELRAGKRKDPVDLYVASKLLEPLVNSKPAVIKSVLPGAKAVYARNGFYLLPPQYTPEQLKMLSGEGPASANPEQMLKDVQRAKEMQEMRQSKERPILLHNQTFYNFEKMLFTLMMIADDRNEDLVIMNQMAAVMRFGGTAHASSKGPPPLETSKTCLSFRGACEVINSEAPKMSEAHAKYLYESLLRLAEQARLLRLDYQELQSPAGSGGAKNTTYRTSKIYPGNSVAETINQLATIAKKPAIIVVPTAEVDASYNKKGGKKTK